MKFYFSINNNKDITDWNKASFSIVTEASTRFKYRQLKHYQFKIEVNNERVSVEVVSMTAQSN